MSDIENLVDEEGENQAVRAFLMYYGGGNATCPIISMRAHLARSGFDGCWPEWAAAPNSTTLTKAGAQLWIRHLFSLEGRTASTIPASEAERSLFESAYDRARTLGTAGMKLAANLCRLGIANIKGVEYLRRDSVMDEVVAWRQAFDKAPEIPAEAARAALASTRTASEQETVTAGDCMARWLYGLSQSEAMPESWRTTCAELAQAWKGTASDTRTAAGEAECDAALRAAPAGQQDADKAARAWMVAHGYGNQPFGYALADLQSRIEAKDYEGVDLARRVEVRTAELMHERQKSEHLMQVLMSVYGLAPNGEDIKLPDGRVFRFNDPNAAETLNALGRAIHAIPEKVAQIAATRFRAEGGNTQAIEPPRYSYGKDGKGPVTFLNPMSPRDFASASPVDVEAERPLCAKAYEARHVGPAEGFSFILFFDGWLAKARTQADAGKDAALREAVGRLIKAKGRFHTEQNYKAVVAAYDATTKPENT